MLAGSCYSKGERIHELPTECSAVLTTIESKEHCHTCHLFLPPHTELTRCSTCSSLWCSKTCRESCLEHEYLCKSRLYSDFLRYVNKSGTIKHVASLILRAIFASLSESTCSNDKTLLKCLSDRVNEFLLPYTKSVYFSEYASSTTNNSDESAESEEIYYLFKSALLFDSVVPSVVFEEVITFNTWVTFHSVLRTFSVPLFTPHPMTVSLQALARIPNTAQRHALFAPFRTYCSPESNQAADSVLATERELLRLVQSINTDDDPFNSLGFHGLVLSSFLPLMRHSCAPNTMYESCVQDEQVYVFNTAMHDVAKDEELTTSYISLTEQSIRQRSIELQRLFGDGFTCECVKCCFERRVGRRSFSSLDTSSDFINACSLLKRPSLLMLMRVYMQQQHFFVALSIGRTLVTADEEGDVFHMMGAALLSLGQCGDAQKVWFSGANKCTTHLRLLADDSKCRAYFRGNVLASTHNQLLCESITVKQGLVAHLSLEPLLSGEECNRIVRIAEELAVSRGGWTTSRHYAVPTTDIAIHTSTLLLQWFNDLMCMTIYPALHRQFGGISHHTASVQSSLHA